MPKSMPHDEIVNACLLLEDNNVMTTLPQAVQDLFASAKHRSMINGFAEVSNEMAEVCELATTVAANDNAHDLVRFLDIARAKLGADKAA